MRNRLSLGALAALMVLPFAPTAATAQDAHELAACFIENSTEADENALRRLVIAALEQASDEVFREKFAAFTDSIVSLAIDACGMKFSDLDTEKGKQAANLYGQHVGKKVVDAAFARIGH